MKVLYLCTDPGIDLAGQGGGAIHVRAAVRALTNLGHSVAIVCSSVSDGPAVAREVHASVHAAPLSRWNRAIVRVLQTANRVAGRPVRQNPDLVRALHNFRFARAAAAVIRQGQPDFIYERSSLWSRAGVTLAKRHRIPHVLEVNAPLAYEQRKYRSLCLPGLAARVERGVWRSADLLIAVSRRLQSYLEGAGVPGERILVLPNGVEPAPFLRDEERAAARERLKLGGRFVIGMVGTFKAWHGTNELLAAFESLYRAESSGGVNRPHLLLVGDGPMRTALEERVRSAGLADAVTFTGTVQHSDVPRHIIAMDVAVAPYPALEESYYSPLKLFEYMAAGRPIVASRMGQIAETLVEGETGLLFDPGNVNELAACLMRVQRTPALAQELGRKAREACRSFTWDNNAARLIEHVRDLPGRGRNPLKAEKGERTVVRLGSSL